MKKTLSTDHQPMEEERLSIYKVSRTIKRKENSLYNALKSIHEDSIFVGEISQLWPELPLVANLRCGLWYFSKFQSTCYFKSTDGHNNNWSFNTSRLNLHLAQLAGQKGGCVIVDSTRKGKRFPDSMSKTIPIWSCVLNRAILNYKIKLSSNDSRIDSELNTSNRNIYDGENAIPEWDCSLHLPLWVSKTERASIENRLGEWTKELEASGADIASVASSLVKPLRPLWISQRTIIWLNEVPDFDSWDFTPLILVSASSSSGIFQQRTTSEFSWNYISGAGDDEESWSRGLTPELFWKHVYDLINSGPDICNQKVADIVEKDRVYRARRGQNAPQITVKPQKVLLTNGHIPMEDQILNSNSIVERSFAENCSVSWLGSTNVAVGSTEHATNISDEIDCILNCSIELVSHSLPNAGVYLQLPIVTSKYDRSSLLNHLPSALNFAKMNLNRGKKLFICCQTGEDISICVCLAILTTLFDDEGCYDDGKPFETGSITKLEMRKRLIFICKFATNARPSRGNLRQVFGFLNRDATNSIS